MPINGVVEGRLERNEQRSLPFVIDTAKAGSYYGAGHYFIEVFVKKQPGDCPAAPSIKAAVVDADDAFVDNIGIGGRFSVSTWSETSWQKGEGQYDFPRGTYQLQIAAENSCGVDYRIRLARR